MQSADYYRAEWRSEEGQQVVQGPTPGLSSVSADGLGLLSHHLYTPLSAVNTQSLVTNKHQRYFISVFLADRTNGLAYATALRPSVVYRTSHRNRLIVCCEAARSAFLATAWLLVELSEMKCPQYFVPIWCTPEYAASPTVGLLVDYQVADCQNLAAMSVGLQYISAKSHHSRRSFAVVFHQ